MEVKAYSRPLSLWFSLCKQYTCKTIADYNVKSLVEDRQTEHRERFPSWLNGLLMHIPFVTAELAGRASAGSSGSG